MAVAASCEPVSGAEIPSRLNFNGTTTLSFDVGDGKGGVLANQSLALTFNAANDVAEIAGDTSASIFEDDPAVLSGTLNVRDDDPGETGFRAPASVDGTYGAFTFNAATGGWTYALDNARAATQALAVGANAIDDLAITSLDGSATAAINIAVGGRNDRPTSGDRSMTIGEDLPRILGIVGFPFADIDGDQLAAIRNRYAAGCW